MKTKIIDRVQLDNADYEIFSGGKIGTDRGIISFKDGKLQEPNWDKLETWVKDSVYTAGMNTFGMLTYSPWESKGIDDVLCPFARIGNEWTLRKINPDWKRIFDETLARIAKVVEPVHDNFVVQIMLFCEPWFHHDSPNPYTNNTDDKRDFYTVPLSVNKIYIDSVMESLKRSGLQFQIIVGCELTVRPGSKVVPYNPPGILEPVQVVREAIWVHEIATYLLETWKVDPTDMGFGCSANWAKNDTGEWYIPDDHTSLGLEVERIVGRMEHKVWNMVHVEFHGACGYWRPDNMSEFAQVVAQGFSATNSRCSHFNTDGDNARLIGPEYASLHDRQLLYWRYCGMATKAVFAFVLKHCASRTDGNRLWLTVLPQTWDTVKKWYMENANALAEAYKSYCGAWPFNKGKKPPVDPVIPDLIEPEPSTLPESPFNWKGEWENNKEYILAGLGLLGLIVLIFILKGC